MAKHLVTGAAGFIGFSLARQLIAQGHEVVGIDNLNDYYSVELKRDRLKLLQASRQFHFQELDLADLPGINQLFEQHRFNVVYHLAAQAGVRYSLQNPHAYVSANLVGFVNLLEACRHHSVDHFVYASSSSVYGANKELPFRTSDRVDHPVSLYAATKKSNELIAHSYSHLFGIPTTGLRFFTVYGPWGRPDMAMFSFTKAILNQQPIDVYNHGQMQRDFTYIDDIVDGVIRVGNHPPKAVDASRKGADQQLTDDPEKQDRSPSINDTSAPYRVYNIGNHRPVALLYLIEVLENSLGKKAIKNFLPMQPGDVVATYADIDDIRADVGFEPRTPIEIGVPAFVQWYREYFMT